ncbi:hypothetical protein [Cupriavidus basilensis]|uniref:hypothetical protein n=1 Tax=Cupriavidus basilensis TaxID=68895 RepID=UPI0011862B02|nr:hypothetical protein [Cupriavidus basilensis]
MKFEDANQGRELLVFIEQLGPLAWQRFESRYPTFKFKGQDPISEDRSKVPPFTSFRFVVEDSEIISKIRTGIDTFEGNVKWVIIGHSRDFFPGKTNWMICPKLIIDVSEMAREVGTTPEQYVEEHYPDFGPLAYADLRGLAEHLKSVFSK